MKVEMRHMQLRAITCLLLTRLGQHLNTEDVWEKGDRYGTSVEPPEL